MKIKKLQTPYITDYSLLIVQDLWQSHYQILLIVLQKEFIELNVNMGMIIKNVKTSGIKLEDCDCFLEYKNFKDDLM